MKNLETINITGWKMSEKFDGVQGVWDGHTLKTRSGNIIHAPKCWIKHLPKSQLIGELWIDYGSFDLVRSIVQSKQPDERWEEVKFLVFCEPKGDLGPFAKAINQIKIKNLEQLENFYNDVLSIGGEGVVLTAPNGEQFKKKPSQDDDGKLIGFTDGRGRNNGKVGALILKLRNGRKLKVGGLDDFIRTYPPEIGSIIKFTFRGLTSSGLPRFASFAGIRAETTLAF